MSNDLVRWGVAPAGDDNQREMQDDGEQWDAPPDNVPPTGTNFGTQRRTAHGFTTGAARQDAAQAALRGDGTFAALRETDAEEHHQSRWDWGDTRTWLVIAALCFGFLAFCAFYYFLPTARHNQNDGPAPVPAIRVY